MKELTIEEKAKRYDEITEKFDVILNLDVVKESGTVPVDDVRKIIPELKESDEKIKEEIINYFECQSRDEPCRKSIHDKWIAWLEKQGQTFTKEEVGNANKVEPKFKAGDWVIDKLGVVCQIANVIENVTNHTYGYDIVGGGYFNDNTEEVRLWNINDAKDGDVLCSEQIILLFKKWEYNSDWNCVIAYAGIDITGKLQITNEHLLISNHTHPATKEQRNTLMKAMADAGYTFDFEKKELNKNSKSFADGGCKAKIEVEQNPAWSEEDEKAINDILWIIEAYRKNGFNETHIQMADNSEKWLKSIKQRIGG